MAAIWAGLFVALVEVWQALQVISSLTGSTVRAVARTLPALSLAMTLTIG